MGKKILSGLIGICILVVIALGLMSYYTVNTGEVAIVSTFGKVSRIEGEGLHFKLPIVETKTIMEVREKIYDFTRQGLNKKFDEKAGATDNSMVVSTKDMQSINIEITVQASIIDPEKLYRAFKGAHEDRFIRPRTREIVQATIAKYTIEEFVSKRAEISKVIFDDLKDDFNLYGLQVSNISIVNHDFSDEYEKAIEAKKVAEQAVEKAKAEQQKLIVEAENRVKLAEYQLKVKELQAQANLIESNSLTPQLIKKMTIEKWDGHLPKVQGNANSFIDVDR
ncbi:hypothetical protein IX317_000174 [Fusobacterium sp. DD29]|uniref:prohibitin family protein n=1 Tax=unclassified Fusobacterium TaxID=2648384 RepID=UPI001B8C4683|nr:MULTISPECIES: prohibitin family protein [unclassified Fusobacterium]MBR8700951.1 hypothetical protein [Fusobacterium sp. DD45]MBR8710857.1 hypothetical protein [Fusobacterium sp. DD28]MBR8748515.1 hypothetical protein [Fusobacterium sp. DD29]MBR8751336.1 hypothetical protein [Fusobacterium sp. DD26]MBR8760782.1 hypothetical protein [Fusobacterium sp. DD25]